MDKLKSSGIILSLIILVCYLGFINVQNISKNSENYLKQIENLVIENNYSEAKNTFENFKFFWEQKSKILGIITHHENLDDIENEMSELSSAIIRENSQDIERLCKSAKSRFENLRKTYELTLENIL